MNEVDAGRRTLGEKEGNGVFREGKRELEKKKIELNLSVVLP
jgi:hypothetical protein